MTLERDGRRAAAAGTAMGGDSYYIFGYHVFADKDLPFPARNAVHAHGRTTASFSTHFFVGAAPGPAS